MSDIRIVVAGAAGRMGRAVLRAVAEAPGCKLASALEARGHPDLGQDAGVLAGLAPLGVVLTDDPLLRAGLAGPRRCGRSPVSPSRSR